MNYGVLERTLPADNGTVETIYEAGEAGFDGIALQIDGPDPTTHPAWSAEGRSDLRHAAVEAGVEIASLGPSFFWQGWEEQEGLLSDNRFRRERSVEVLEHTIDAAGALGADLVLIPFFELCEITEEKHEQRVIEALRAVADVAELAGVTVTLETSLPAADNAELVDAVDSPAVKICYDPANKVALYGLDAVAEIRELGSRIGELHVKEFTEPPPPFPDNYARLGEGAVDQEAVADAIHEVGFDGWAILETQFDKPLAHTVEELAFTKDLYER